MRDRRISFLVIMVLVIASMVSGCLLKEKEDANKDDGGDQGSGNLTIPDTTKQLGSGTLDLLSSVSEEGKNIVFEGSDPSLDAIGTGDVLSFGISDRTPYGLLRKVLDIERSGDKTTLLTVQASMEEAIEEGQVIYNQTLSEPLKTIHAESGVIVKNDKTRSGSEDVIFDNVILHENDQGDRVVLNGHLDLEFDLLFTLSIDDFTITECCFGTRTTFDGELGITSDRAMDFSIEITVARFEYAPIIVPMGPIEIVMVPVLSLVIGSSGSLGGPLTITAGQIAVLEARVDHPDWTPDSDFTANFIHSTPALGHNSTITCYAGPEMSLMLWGVAGPYILAHGYVQGEHDAEDAWWIYGGLSFGMGFRIEALGKSIEEWEEPDIIDFRRLIASSMDDLAGGWVVEKLDYSMQLTRPVLARGPDGELAVCYHSSDPHTGDMPIRAAILKEGTWSFIELVRTCDYSLIDFTYDGEGRLHLVHYDGGFDQRIVEIVIAGKDLIRTELTDPDMPGRSVTDLALAIDGSGRPNVCYVLSDDPGGGPFYKFSASLLKRAILQDGGWNIETLNNEKDTAITGLDLEVGGDGALHMVFFECDLTDHHQEIVHCEKLDDSWTNTTVFREDVFMNDPGGCSLEIGPNDDMHLLFDDNNGTLHYHRTIGGQWAQGESPGIDDPDQDIFTLYIGSKDRVYYSYIDSDASNSHSLFLSMLGEEGWDRVEVLEWSGWRFAGGNDLSEKDGDIFILFNDGLYLRCAKRSYE